jgi:urease accessory protein
MAGHNRASSVPMIAAEPVRHQRAEGSVLLRTGARGLVRMREAHSAKARFPFGGNEAILINTSGGIAGGDRFAYDIGVEAGSHLTVTTQAAERVYRTLGPPGEVNVKLNADAGASLFWLPQETILFDGASLSRHFEVDLAGGARFLAVESIILGRMAMGEQVRTAALRDRWRIRQAGRLILADDLTFDGPPPATFATLGEATAFATVLMVHPDADSLTTPVRAAVGELGSASAWSGKLVARLAAKDGFELRKALIPALTVLARPSPLPKVWSL